jgi:hypothetical protein
MIGLSGFAARPAKDAVFQHFPNLLRRALE